MFNIKGVIQVSINTINGCRFALLNKTEYFCTEI